MNDLQTQNHPSPCHEIELRVRYSECDSMGVAHHSTYPVWLEIARTELLRQTGRPYEQLERQGVLFVVAKLSVRYKRPAKYDQLLRVTVQGPPSTSPSQVKIDHQYEIRYESELLTTASTTLVCVDRDGKLQAIPDGIFG